MTQQKKEQQIKRSQCAFRPVVSPRSVKLAISAREKDGAKENKFKLHDYLLYKGQEYQSNKMVSKDKLDSDEYKKCTFQPKLNTQTLKIAQVRNVPIFQRLFECHKERICEKYRTCSPSTSEKKNDNKETVKKQNINKNSKHSIVQSKIEFKMEVDEEKVTSCGVNVNDYESGIIPQLFIDVHLDDQSIHRLTIYEGDDPKKLARDFCNKYDLDKAMLNQL